MGGSIQTSRDHEIFPLEVREENVDIHDIAHALSNVCRFNGHTRRFYSVAQHSCYVHDYVARDLAAQGLFHDVSEYLLPDVVSPIKSQIYVFLNGRHITFKNAEHAITQTVFDKFQIEYPPDLTVKMADRIVLKAEQFSLMPPRDDFDYAGKWPSYITAWTPDVARREFLSRARELERAGLVGDLGL